ncbi:MAG TPA: thermostable hemolysin [Burkholderiales bacterium]
MSFNPSRITVSIARTPAEVSEALDFCGSVYERNYGTRWTVPPDLFFVAREDDDIVATGGLTFAALHSEIASERYYKLTQRMRHFVATNREDIVEFGRFASVKMLGAKAIMHSTLLYCALANIDFLFAWANPTVVKHTSRLGLNLWPIAVALDLNNAMGDTRWACPPAGFFVREHPPQLHLIAVPFCDNVIRTLGEECGTQPEWRTSDAVAARAMAMKPTSVVHAAPKLVRSEADIARPQGGGDAFPSFGSTSDPDARSLRKPPPSE